MIVTLMFKSLRDVRIALFVVILLLGAFQCLWTRVTDRIGGDLLPQLRMLSQGRVTDKEIEDSIFGGPGKLVKALIGGDSISIFSIKDMLSIGYVHSLVITILAIWAIGRAAGAIVGEIDRGTMELLLSLPLARFRLILAHFCMDLLTIPLICLGLWAGNWIGIALVEPADLGPGKNPVKIPVEARMFLPALWNVGALMFAISGYTMWLSSRGRFRGRVLGITVLITLLQFLVNVIGQLWDKLEPFRPLTVFYYYQPQQIILKQRWTTPLLAFWSDNHAYAHVNVVVVLICVGLAGYGLALWTFCRRDLPAPL
jgi:ABC-2 type transport system permease protein